jgi:uncharacterized protein
LDRHEVTHPAGLSRGVLFSPRDARPYFEALAPDFFLLPQVGASLGERLDNALAALFARGYRRAIILNSDGPTLPAAHLKEAFTALAGGADVVFGPCEDGGYYLIGAMRPVPRLLREVTMSTPRVLADTLALAQQEGLRVALLPRWYDVDEPADLRRLARELAAGPEEVAPATRRWLRERALI